MKSEEASTAAAAPGEADLVPADVTAGVRRKLLHDVIWLPFNAKLV